MAKIREEGEKTIKMMLKYTIQANPKQFAMTKSLTENEIKNICRIKYLST